MEVVRKAADAVRNSPLFRRRFGQQGERREERTLHPDRDLTPFVQGIYYKASDRARGGPWVEPWARPVPGRAQRQAVRLRFFVAYSSLCIHTALPSLPSPFLLPLPSPPLPLPPAPPPSSCPPLPLQAQYIGKQLVPSERAQDHGCCDEAVKLLWDNPSPSAQDVTIKVCLNPNPNSHRCPTHPTTCCHVAR